MNPRTSAAKAEIPRRATLRHELVLCGKKNCTKLHGPYWYAYWQDGPRTRKVYIGKKLPQELGDRRLDPKPRKRGSAHDPRVVDELTLDDQGVDQELVDETPAPLSSTRGARPTTPAMTDLCECGEDYGSHDGKGRCGRCDCTRFRPRRSTSTRVALAKVKASERKAYKLTGPQWQMLKDVADHELRGLKGNALVNSLRSRPLVERELVTTIDRGIPPSGPAIGYGRLVEAEITELGKRVYSRLIVGTFCFVCGRPMAFAQSVQGARGTVCVECHSRASK